MCHRRGTAAPDLRAAAAGAALLAFVLPGCTSELSPSAGVEASRDTMPDGTVVVRYPALPIGEVHLAVEDLRIGSVDEDPNAAFGDVRGIDAASDGTIYVLDHLASEVRMFGPDGTYLRTIVTPGEGPGEISAANGILLAGDSLLWIQDHGKWSMIGVTPDGDEVTRFPMPVRSYGYMWNGTVDRAGRVWKPASHFHEPPQIPPDPGFSEIAYRSYLKWYDHRTEAADSVYVGDVVGRGHVEENSRGGWSHRGIPFEPEIFTVVDRDGGFWHVQNATYRIARLGEAGDTTLVIESDVVPQSVTGADRTAYIEQQLDYDADSRAAVEEIAAAMPETKPVIEGLVVDDRGWLWVNRVVPTEETPLYDIFDRDGAYLGSVRLAFSPFPYLPLRIRDGRIYAVVQDELDISYVVRAPVPAPIGAVIPTESADN